MPCEQIRVLNDEESKDAEPTESETDDVFLRKIEATLLTQVSPGPPSDVQTASSAHIQPRDIPTVAEMMGLPVQLPCVPTRL